MSFRRWVYHATKKPRIINDSEFEQFEANGWADTPAKFLNLKDVGIDTDLVDAGDEDESAKAQQALDAVGGVVESINGALNIGGMNKIELEDYAKEHFGVDLDRRKSVPNLRAEVEKLTKG